MLGALRSWAAADLCACGREVGLQDLQGDVATKKLKEPGPKSHNRKGWADERRRAGYTEAGQRKRLKKKKKKKKGRK